MNYGEKISDMIVLSSISGVDGDIRFMSPKNSHGTVDTAFSWKVLLNEIIWRLQVQSQQ